MLALQGFDILGVSVYRFGGGVDLVNVGDRGERGHDLVLFAVERDRVVHVHDLGGQGACLVQTDHIDAGEGLDTVHFVDEYLFLCQTNDGYRQNGGGQEDHAAGDHADQRADGRDDGVVEHLLLDKIFDDEHQDTDGEDDDGADIDDGLERFEDLRIVFLDILRFVVDLGGVAVGADAVDAAFTVARSDKAAGEKLVAELFGDQIRFACQKAFVGAAFTVDKDTVGGYLIAAREQDDVIVFKLSSHVIVTAEIEDTRAIILFGRTEAEFMDVIGAVMFEGFAILRLEVVI